MEPANACPHCGSARLANAPAGLCPLCLLGHGLRAGRVGGPDEEGGGSAPFGRRPPSRHSGVLSTLDDSLVNGTRTLTLTINSLTNVTGSLVIDPATQNASVSVLDNDRPTVIPTMSPLGLLLMGLFLAGVAGFGIRRKI